MRAQSWIGATVLAVVLAATALLLMGRSPICTCGHVALWHGQVNSAENSQQLTDWYSFSHVIHGFLFYAAGRWLLARSDWRARLFVATLVEAAWELLENSPLIIDRYRAATIAVGYTGDSVLNSVADIGCMILGFALARRCPVWAIVALAVAFELFTLWAVRDNLTLNVWMLVAPSDVIRSWQSHV